MKKREREREREIEGGREGGSEGERVRESGIEGETGKRGREGQRERGR